MRKLAGMLAAVFMLSCVLFPAGAESLESPDYVLEGFDSDTAKHDWETNLFFARMQEDTGIRFEYRQVTDADKWTARKEQILQGEDLPDALFKAGLTDRETLKMAEAGILIDLKPYLAEYAPDLQALLEARPEVMEAITLPDGTIRALPSVNELPANNLIWINRTWLANLQLEAPKTAEEFTEVLRAFKEKDPNRNGSADEVPLSVLGMWDLRFLGHAFGITDNDYYLSLQDGQVSSALTTDRNRAFLTWLHQLWEENLLSHQAFTTVDSLRQVTDSKAAMIYGVFLSSSPLTVVPAESLSQYTALEPLACEGIQRYRSLLGSVTRGTFALTRNCREPEKLVAWVNRLYTEEGSRLLQVGREGEEYMWTEDGTWEWMADLETVANEILPAATLADGGVAPGIVTEDFQAKYAERGTRELVESLARVGRLSVLPFPQRYLTAEDAEKAAALQAEIAPFAEQRMAEFVTGDTPLDDPHWEEFTAELNRRGLPEMIALWQKYAE